MLSCRLQIYLYVHFKFFTIKSRNAPLPVWRHSIWLTGFRETTSRFFFFCHSVAASSVSVPVPSPSEDVLTSEGASFSFSCSLYGPLPDGWYLQVKYVMSWALFSHCCPFVRGSITESPFTHWGRDKMAAIFQTTFSNAFSWMKMFKFLLRFHWSLFPRVQLTIFHHWFR